MLIAFDPVNAQKARPEIGVARDMEEDSLLSVSGYGYMVESIGKIMSPVNIDEARFAQNLEAIRSMKTRIYAVNIFLPGNLKMVGPDIDEKAVLVYAEKVFQRCKQAGIPMVIWGSAGSRRLPEGFDKATAMDQFISLARKVALLAQKYDIFLTLENLNTGETNFLTSVAEVADVVRKVDQPNFKVCVDIYHMLKENEPASEIRKADGLIYHCDIAERENRTPPGTLGDNLVPYLVALKEAGFQGKIIIEARWTDVTKQLPAARKYLEGKIAEVWN